MDTSYFVAELERQLAGKPAEVWEKLDWEFFRKGPEPENLRSVLMGSGRQTLPRSQADCRAMARLLECQDEEVFVRAAERDALNWVTGNTALIMAVGGGFWIQRESSDDKHVQLRASYGDRRVETLGHYKGHEVVCMVESHVQEEQLARIRALFKALCAAWEKFSQR